LIRFVFPRRSESYLGRLSRLRWRRAFAGCEDALEGVLEVPDERSIPAPGAAAGLAACAGLTAGAIYPLDSEGGADLGWRPPPISTLRELEAIAPSPATPVRPLREGPEHFPARFVVAGAERPAFVAPGFRVVRVPETFGAREEVLARIPPGARRLLDVGCGAGETGAEARRRRPALRVEGIEREPGLAARARSVLDALHEGDALGALRDAGARGEAFDVIVFADSLEHFRDPFAVLEAAREVASDGATVVVSAPNAASAPIVSDLLSGRFDPVAAGPEDAGHLRWFTRRSLGEMLAEAGFSEFRCDPVALPSESGLGADLAAGGIESDAEALGSIQWIATARYRRPR
jgi:SAM-dependent methyltransferase